MKKTIPILVLALSALYSVMPFLIRPEFIFAEDIGYHMNWAHQVGIGIREGIFYPRWLSTSNSGYGSPTTIFYAPLFYFLTGIVNLFAPSLVISLKVITFTGFLLSGMTMYVFLRNFCGHISSLAGGMFYQLLPYHIFDLYWRGTLAETFAFLWLPLILHFAYKGFAEDTFANWMGMAFSYAGLIVTHIASAYIFTFVMAAFALFLTLTGKNYRLFLKFILALVYGLSTSAAYFIPMFFERRFVHIEWLTEVRFGDYRHNFLFMSENLDNPFHINLGLIVILQVLLVISFSRIYYMKKNLIAQKPIFAFFYWLFASSLFISTPLSMPVWRLIPGFPTIQFPWRWVMVSTFAVSVLNSLTFNTLSFDAIKKDKLLRIPVLIICGFVFANIYLTSRYVVTAEPVQEKDMKWILKDGGDVIEYRPIWLTDKKKDFSIEEWTPIVFKEGDGTVDVVSWKSHSRQFTVYVAIPSVVRVSTFYYPGWTALINGREVPIGIEKDGGAMLLSIPAGRNEVLLEFRDTPLRRAAKWVSIISLLVAFIVLMVARFSPKMHLKTFER